MGCTMSCVSPQKCRFKYSSKSFIRRKSSRLFRKKNPQEGQVKSNSIVNILCYVSPKKEFTPKELEKIQNINWDQKFAYDPFSGWKKSSTSVKNLGKMIYSSKVRFRFQHCQEVHDCYLDLFQTHLHFLSNNTTGLTYQGTLPLKELNVCNLRGSEPGKHAFKITGSCLNHIIIYCSSEEQLEIWLGHLKEQVELNGGTVTSSEAKTYARIKSKRDNGQEKEELRNSVNNEPIYEWEGSQRESLGQVAFVSKVKVQHLPCQDLHNRLLVLYPATLIMLSDEDNCLFYKCAKLMEQALALYNLKDGLCGQTDGVILGKLPLNAITITTHCNDDNPNSFMIEGKLINPIIVSCMDECDYQDWLHHLGTLDVAIEGPQGHVYDPIYTPTKIESPRRSMESCELDSRGSCKVSEKAHSWSYQPPRGSGRSLFEFPEDLASPGYTEPLCYISSRPTSYETQTTRQFSESSGLESSSEESFINIEHSKLRNSPCERDSYASIADSLSPLYSTPYKPGRSCQRDKDMRNNIMRFAADKLPHSYSSPVCLQLSGPPSEKKRRSPHSTINEICTDTPDRWEGCGAFSKFSLLPAPPRMSIQQQEQLNTLEYDPDLLGYQETSDHLEPFRRNKLSNDYDNIWEFHEEPAHAHNSVISHRMDFHLGGEDINTKSTQKRWS